MDSISQLALGAALGEAVAGKQVSYRAPLWGALCGTLPDLDTFYPFADPIAAFTYHRSYSHALFILALLTPLIVGLIVKIHPSTRDHWQRWGVLVALVLLTHPLLDSFTVYGTQLLLPFSATPVAFSTIFIIDPLYTLPLLIGVLTALCLRRHSCHRKINLWGLGLSTTYLLCTIGVKAHVNDVVERSLQRWDINQEKFLTTPAPFNIFLWRILALDGDRYIETFYSVFDADLPSEYLTYPTGHARLASLEKAESMQRLQWFTRGFYRVREDDAALWIQDLRMGSFERFVFSFKIATIESGEVRPVAVTLAPQTPLPWGQLARLFQRIVRPISPHALAGYPS